MTDMTCVADTSAFRFWMPVIQTVLGTAIIGSFALMMNSFDSLRTQVASGQLSQALISQDVQYLKKSDEVKTQAFSNLNTMVQGHEFQLKAINEYLKQDAATRRPRS